MRLFAAIGMTLMLAACVSGGGRMDDRDRYNRAAGKPVANPSAVVKAELSFARLAQEKGQWTAFRETAADDAVMFVPDLTNAQQWLKGKADPAQAVEWQPHKISMSCDGSLAVSTGAWQSASGSTGAFITIWRLENFDERHRGRDQKWKWVFDHGFPLDKPLEEPDFIETAVASCQGKPVYEASGVGNPRFSNDRTLMWNAYSGQDAKRRLSVNFWDGNELQTIINEEFAGPAS